MTYTNHDSDGYYFSCCKNECKTRVTIKTGTLFEISRNSVMEIVKVIFHYFVRGYNAT